MIYTRFTIGFLLFPGIVFLKVYSLLGLHVYSWIERQFAKRTVNLLSSCRFRQKLVKGGIESFNGHIGPKPPGVTRIITIWENDGRMACLDHEARCDPACEVFHIPRNIFDVVRKVLFAT